MTEFKHPEQQLSLPTVVGIEAKSFGLQIDPTLQKKLAAFVSEVTGTVRDPSRNWFGLELVKELSRNSSGLTSEQRERVLLISCDDCTDGAGAALGIESVSLSPHSLHPPSRPEVSVAGSNDPILDDILEERSVFQFTPELFDQLRTKQAIVFLGDGSDRASAMFKLYSFLNNDFCRFLIDQKYIFFALGFWSASEGFRYDDFNTNQCIMDASPHGQDFWSPPS